MKLLNTINSPADLKRLQASQLPLLADELRDYIIPVSYTHLQFGDQRSRFAAQEVQNPSIPVGDRRCHLDSSLSQMLHEVQIKREFFCSQLFKESKYLSLIHI